MKLGLGGFVEGVEGGVVIDYSANGIRLKIHRSTRTSWEYVEQQNDSLEWIRDAWEISGMRITLCLVFEEFSRRGL